MRLLAVPGASVRRTQRGHQAYQFMKSFRHLIHFCGAELDLHYTWFSACFNRPSVGWRVLRRLGAYGRVRTLHLERGKGL
ncbi:hypothetical protein LBMAG45_01530 [Nitrospirota bacterium]|nr:hypothetical protein LBMAG45_01530 [Nitrospirota bacterium]